MRNNIELNKEEYNALLEQFYTYFEDGYKFEEFLKIYLEKIGLEEVYVTKRSGDGGIDLTAIRKGIVDYPTPLMSRSMSRQNDMLRQLQHWHLDGSLIFIFLTSQIFINCSKFKLNIHIYFAIY